MRVYVIACEVLYRELCHCAAVAKNIVDLLFLSQGLHDLGSARMSAAIQEKIDAVDAKRYQAIALGFGLCNNGVVGLKARDVPLIVPRAHDCITLFLGSHSRYMEYFAANPGTYFMTTGWHERDKDNLESFGGGVMGQLGIFRTYQEYVEKYGEENAKYLMETMGDWRKHYSRMTHIDMGVSDETAARESARTEAEKNGWAFEVLKGNIDLLGRLVDGPWPDEDFLTVNPGQQILATADNRVLGAK
ncbi:MAG: DUF1638 domain-containing protein [Phycisphaerae bacterium]|nr:DUF1638 domain-containing protein [Phycisphaerae bacterium]